MTKVQPDQEEDTTRRPSLRWKERFSRTTRLSTIDSHVSTKTNSDNTFDNNSIHSQSSIEKHVDNVRITKSALSRNKDFHETFKQVPLEEPLLQDFKCALQKDIIIQGRLFITKNFVCFKSTSLAHDTSLEFKVHDIKQIDRIRMKRWMPRVIQVTMNNDDEKHIFTSFLTSLSSRDDAYYRLLGVWEQIYPPMVASSSSSTTSTTTNSANTSTVLSTTNNTSNNSALPTTSTTTNNSTVESTSQTIQEEHHLSTSMNNEQPAPSTSHFRIFHRKRAQTVSAQQTSTNRPRSGTSNSTPLEKTNHNHVTWNDNQSNQQQQSESSITPSSIIKPIESPVKPTSLSSSSPSSSSSAAAIATASSSSSSSSKKSLMPTPPSILHDPSPTRTNSRLFITGGLLVFLSYVYLTYKFYQVTLLFNDQYQQLHSHSTPSSHPILRHLPSHQFQDTTWISGHLQEMKNQAQLWEQETLRQRKRLLSLIPS
ncbi:uncharacterized protein BX664DRAFT_339093 [Halteromyces radiatus]|uniref:uncharacterized protein n=1 Tax=Halteromyces radiatus TaxID=101107 RepID=UPI00221F7947|nr:uncharacterized protein BX664DRAFT_339093 [Halteromyces radiatus]KAI8082798.1 hypothetical protein BX664DRAFT_339093 [Halteromyces radiatus]